MPLVITNPIVLFNHLMVVLALFILVSCSAGARKTEWDNLDYSSVYRKAKQKEYDTEYTPAYNSCVDDDFMSCQ